MNSVATTTASQPASDATAGTVASLFDVGVRIGATPILSGVNLLIGEGEAIGLSGSNGSGKTTLLRVLATLLMPSEGDGRVLGADLRAPVRLDVRPSIVLVGHTSALYPQLTLAENLEFIARVRSIELALASKALRTVGLDGAARRRASDCSYGMLRRAELARALLCRPRLLLLDEPAAGLDPQAEELVSLVVREVCGRGGAAVVASHGRGRLAQFADRLLEMSLGRVFAAS